MKYDIVVGESGCEFTEPMNPPGVYRHSSGAGATVMPSTRCPGRWQEALPMNDNDPDDVQKRLEKYKEDAHKAWLAEWGEIQRRRAAERGPEPFDWGQWWGWLPIALILMGLLTRGC